jgi:hypothetical protein
LKDKSQKIAVTPAQNITPYYSLPWLFQHQELLTSTTTERPWEQKELINKLNYLNFIDGYVSLLLDHKKTNKYILLKARPQPCVKDELICRLDLPDDLIDLTEYSFNYLMIDDGLSVILAPVQLVSVESYTLKLNLPDKSRVITTRKTRRYYCQNITCEVIQDGFNTHGALIDFTPSAFGIRLTGHENVEGFDEKQTAFINLYQNSTKLFSGLCCCIRNGMNSPDVKLVFAPVNTQIELVPKKKIRNPRQQIAPSFTINFKHPLFQENVERDVLEISSSGFSVRDNLAEETLLSGMIIPILSIVYAGVLKMRCSVRVLYRHEDCKNNIVHCGLAITDMDVHSYSRLNHLVGIYLDGNARVSTEVAMDALWEFFFDTGFIYGEKYQHLQPHREIFKETYRKLYRDNPDIARHFVYERNGKIYGHMSMVHAYNSSWVIQHFAARPMETKIAGLMIIRQITYYINGFHRFASGGMDHVIAHYQPENEIMNKIFGGFVDYLEDRKGSSQDLFSYLHIQKGSLNQAFPAKWTLRKCIPSDFAKLTNFYENHSGGLLLDALELDSPMNSLKESFLKAGFKRNCQTFCLCFGEEQVAFFIVDQSDLGLNLSDLLNAIKIIIINKAESKWDILLSAVYRLSFFYEENYIPLLIYPHDYLSKQDIELDKNYLLWIFKIKPYSEQYLEYMKSKFRIRYKAE